MSLTKLSVNQELMLFLIGSQEHKFFSGALKLVMTIFLIQSEVSHKLSNCENFRYNFYRGYLCPFDDLIYKDLEILEEYGFLAVDVTVSVNSDLEKRYSLTNAGIVKFDSILKKSDFYLFNSIKKWTDFVSKESRESILRFIHKEAKSQIMKLGIGFGFLLLDDF